MIWLLSIACGVPPAPPVPDEGEHEPCPGLAALTADATSGDEERELLFPDATCAGDTWRLDASVDDETDPPDRVTAATWNLLTGSFGADTWDLDDSMRAEILTADAGACEDVSTVWVLFPWWGDVLGEMEVLPRGDAYEGSGMYSGSDVTFHIDTPIGAADAGTMRVCEPFDDARAFTTEMTVEVDGDEDQWSAEWPRGREGVDTVFVVGGVVTAEGEVVAAAGASAE